MSKHLKQMENIRDILYRFYDLESQHIKAMVGEVNLNYRVRCESGSYVFKSSPHSSPAETALSQEECRILENLSKKMPGNFQEPVPASDGRLQVEDKEAGRIYRLFRYIPGKLLAESEHTSQLLSSFGEVLALMDLALIPLEMQASRARRYHWDNTHFDLAYQYAHFVRPASLRKLIDYFHMKFHEEVVPSLPRLRHSLIHGDANDYNVLVEKERVKAILDFGDAVYSPLINEVAIALAYILCGKDDPLAWAAPLLKSYTEILPLNEEEIELLYYLVGTRISISLCHSARGRSEQPGNDYLGISEKAFVKLLQKWMEIGPVAASRAFRHAAGLPLPPILPLEEDREKRSSYLGENLSLSYKTPIRMRAAAFQFMYDDRGNSFLDMRNNIPHVGHNHPRVVRAGQKAMARLNTNTRYLYDEIRDYSETLLAKFPKKLNKVFYVNSGSAASDLALRLARTHTGREKMLVMEHGYHGNTAAAIEVSHYKFAGKGGKGLPASTLVAGIPSSGNPLPDLDAETRKASGEIAAFITEPIVSAAGGIVIEKEYMHKLYAFTREQGGVCISDEVQTGFGRPGKYFWGFEYTGLIPDIVILSKPIANGHPMAAVVCTNEIAEAFNNGMEFFSSFGGNPVSCAIGQAVLEVIAEEELDRNAADTGAYLIKLFEDFRKGCPYIGEIRGMGLSLGVEIVKNGPGSAPAPELADRWVNALREKNILLGTDGPHDNVLKIKPPLCFTKADADRFIRELRNLV